MNLLCIQSLWIISLGTPSASLRLGFSKVERVLSLTGKFPRLGTAPYPLKGFASSTRNIESIIKACTNPLFAYLSQWHPASLLELPKCWTAPLLSILRVKWLTQELVSSCGKVKVRIKMLGTGCMSVPFLLLAKHPLKCRQSRAWFSKLSQYQNPLETLLNRHCWVPLPECLNQ